MKNATLTTPILTPHPQKRILAFSFLQLLHLYKDNN